MSFFKVRLRRWQGLCQPYRGLSYAEAKACPAFAGFLGLNEKVGWKVLEQLAWRTSPVAVLKDLIKHQLSN